MRPRPLAAARLQPRRDSQRAPARQARCSSSPRPGAPQRRPAPPRLQGRPPRAIRRGTPRMPTAMASPTSGTSTTRHSPPRASCAQTARRSTTSKPSTPTTTPPPTSRASCASPRPIALTARSRSGSAHRQRGHSRYLGTPYVWGGNHASPDSQLGSAQSRRPRSRWTAASGSLTAPASISLGVRQGARPVGRRHDRRAVADRRRDTRR